MEVPKHWRDYLCEDYFNSPFASTGYWDEPGAIWYIEPIERVEEDTEAQFLQVGRPGVDSIGFGYRKGVPGFWALHRIEGGRLQYLAPTVQQFLDGWLANKISV
ncbi:MAG: hypothetical protein QM703_11990 [Gemmatales bacterium]